MEEKEAAQRVAYMWGCLPGALQQRTPLLPPTIVRLPPPFSWMDVCGGGCGFAMAISESGKLITWGSTDDLGQSYVTSGKHGFIKRRRGVANNVDKKFTREAPRTNIGEVYTWGWKECIPSGKVFGDLSAGASTEKEVLERQSSFSMEQVSPRSQGSRSSGGAGSANDARGGEESTKRRRVSSAKQAAESSSSAEESLSALPCLVTLNAGVRISTVAAGGRHTLALSDIGQVWGWGYGGEGQLGLGSRIRMVSSPHPVPCIDSSSYGKDRSSAISRGSISEGQSYRVPGNYVKAIACGGRHSAVITDAGALLTFGWGLYGQCGQGCTDDELSPVCVSSLLGIRIESVAAGLWHTVCVSSDGDVYAFGGNQFGQLGTGAEQAEMYIPYPAFFWYIDNSFTWQLGLGDVIDRNTPSEVVIAGCVPKKVACGWWHTLLLAESPT
ncbi:hypothetical protein L484_009887 [Morus notabilis]|uniref:Ultraviolet-B receptor UVR8 n=1 Tax=Morus notabilis TaxID=981085 RepID=W9RRI0_9ROSA|nr:hypothetical protein L484_009887 [Morus notabilis]